MSDDVTNLIEHVNGIINSARTGLGHSANPQLAAAVILADALERTSTRLEEQLAGIQDRLSEIRDKLTGGGS